MKRWLGRSTLFAAFFALTAFVLALLGKLTADYAAVISVLHIGVVSRAVAEDKFAAKQDVVSGVNSGI